MTQGGSRGLGLVWDVRSLVIDAASTGFNLTLGGGEMLGNTPRSAACTIPGFPPHHTTTTTFTTTTTRSRQPCAQLAPRSTATVHPPGRYTWAHSLAQLWVTPLG